jgi:signal transduction histidine kinase
MALLDEQLRYHKINPAAARINNYPFEEHLGKTIPDVIPTIAHVIVPLYEQVLVTGEPIINMEVSGDIPSWPDVLSYFDLSIFPVYGDDNTPVGVGGIFMDITERKLAEAALHQSQERLTVLSRRLVAVQESERRALARELHDEIGQILTALNLVINIDTDLPSRQIRKRLNEARAIINDLMQRVRNLSLDLRPTMLDDMGLISALQWHFERYTEQTGIRVFFRHSQIERRFQADIEIAIYRVVQEALTNVARHAHTDKVEVRLLADKECIMVRIDDQGRGFDPQAVMAMYATSGLAGMQERIALLGGELTIEAMPGEGTHLIIELPLLTRRS